MDPFIAQIVLFGGNFAPRGWAFCEGQLLAISSNSALFSLLGTTYGGDGRTTFGLPDLRGRAPIHKGSGPGLSNFNLGQKGGTETNTLTVPQLPSHTHTAHINASTDGGEDSTPAGNFLGESGSDLYTSSGGTAMGNDSVSVGNTGSSQPVNNRSPYLALNYIIALQGVFPSRS